MTTSAPEVPEKDRQARILDAAVSLLGTGGISAVSMRAVARGAGVSLGLVTRNRQMVPTSSTTRRTGLETRRTT